AACDKKGIWFIWRKIEMRLFICGSYADASDHAVFPVAVIINHIFMAVNWCSNPDRSKQMSDLNLKSKSLPLHCNLFT
ncbi:MAG: hypothetical protein MUO82_06610, partial [Candidatus Thermoplasmatota archaeon]|nr:hypothetical protein [Candidatus Thermoplasmatota archaeon]